LKIRRTGFGLAAPERSEGGRSSMVEREFSKLHTRVRFPSPAPISLWSNEIKVRNDFGIFQKTEMRIKVRMTAFSYAVIVSESV
jgi:hypothetical protein